MDERLGIYRGEALAIMGALADINAKMRERHEAVQKMLHEHIERITAELEAKKRKNEPA